MGVSGIHRLLLRAGEPSWRPARNSVRRGEDCGYGGEGLELFFNTKLITDTKSR
jgi:hypothetical protein